jgi:Fe-S-cluster-containing dehydrogenase component
MSITKNHDSAAEAMDHAARSAIERELMPDFVELGLFQGQQLLVLDLLKCTRCDECVRACADGHAGVTRVIRDGPRFEDFLVAISCRSCHDPRCLNGCPVDAIHRERFGMEVVISYDRCIGCAVCATNCPYGSIRMVELENGALRELSPNDYAKLADRYQTVEEAQANGSGGQQGNRIKAQIRAANCDLCLTLEPSGKTDPNTSMDIDQRQQRTPRCVYACPHDAAHRVTGEKVLEWACERREQALKTPSRFGWLYDLFMI